MTSDPVRGVKYSGHIQRGIARLGGVDVDSRTCNFWP
jgi:hypothetical protein